MRKVFIYSSVLLVILVAGAYYVHSDLYSIYGNAVKKVSVGGEVFRVEVADTQEKKQLGLGGRNCLCEKCGMLFVFSESGQHSFWMDGMRFSLDILWLENGKVVEIKKNTPFDSREIFSPKADSDSVLELVAGTVDKLGIKIGDAVAIE